MNYFLKILYASFIFLSTHILYNIALKKRKIILWYEFIWLNMKFFIMWSSDLFFLWSFRTFKYTIICHSLYPFLCIFAFSLYRLFFARVTATYQTLCSSSSLSWLFFIAFNRAFGFYCSHDASFGDLADWIWCKFF